MEFEELIRERYSVRKYDAAPVEEEKLQKILEKGEKGSAVEAAINILRKNCPEALNED